MPKAKMIDIKKPVYAMASMDGQSAELTFYGDIYEQRPRNWWTGKEIEGNFILLDEFLEDLETVSRCKVLTIRMNSYGGDAGVSNTIHNRLRELQNNGVKITCIVDGVAMSGGSLIMCACDTVRVNPSSLIMIHKCISLLWGNYNADELREQAQAQDAWDKLQIEIYQRKTGLSATVLSHMMSNTTYMTGREAKEKGFADELIDDGETLSIAASADGRSLFVRGVQIHLAPGMFAPDNIPTVESEASAAVKTDTKMPEVTGSNEGGIPMTMEELRAKYPDEVAQVEAEARAAVDISAAANDAVKAERERLAAIDEVAALFPDELVKEAKYGEKPCTAAEMTLLAAKAAAQQGRNFLAAQEKDAAASGIENIPPAPADVNGEKNTLEQARADARAYNASKKEVR